MAVDDSALLTHRSEYDPAKAREYYLRTRQLKGRRKAGAYDESRGRRYYRQVQNLTKPGSEAAMRASRRKKLLAEKAALEKRLEELQNALELLVNAAKKRAGVKEDPAEKNSDPTETAAKNEKAKKDQPLTEAQKRDKREASREAYAKENRTTLATSVQDLRDQVQDMRAKLETAVAEARRKASQSNTETASKGR